eukprot:TRINITY_DN2681_c0_g1_i1.p1 TRINITY_DN2681_c0_g1~~TRINITY_DN2681_c0_g1_i1.p1  ORF type:complete len:542 (+),score=147.08 TRINITY_DN2681_c0_g1_i1:158-1783(+)
MAAMGSVTALLSHSVVPGAPPGSHNNVLVSRLPTVALFQKTKRVCHCGLNRRLGTVRSLSASESDNVSIGFQANGKSVTSRKVLVHVSATAGEMAVEEPKVEEAAPEVDRAVESEVAATSGAGTGEDDAASADNAVSSSKAPRRRITTKRGGAQQKRKVTIKMEDLQLGQELPGKVRSVMTYGAFIDIGSSTDGLVHISELSNGFVKDVADAVTVGEDVTVRVLEVDIPKGRIGLSMRDRAAEAEAEAERGSQSEEGERSSRSRVEAVDEAGRPINRAKIAGSGAGRRTDRKRDEKPTHGFRKGQTVQGVVTKIGNMGASIELKEGVVGMLYRESMPFEEGENGEEVTSIKVGQSLEVQIAKLEKNNRISVTMKEEEMDLKALNAQLNTADSEKTMNAFERAFRLARLVKDSPKLDVETTTVVSEAEVDQQQSSVDEIPAVSTTEVEATSAVEIPATEESAPEIVVPEAAADEPTASEAETERLSSVPKEAVVETVPEEPAAEAVQPSAPVEAVAESTEVAVPEIVQPAAVEESVRSDPVA